jgi:hypothetical protein
VGGGFYTYRGTSAQRLTRVNLTTGALDATFTKSLGFNSKVTSMVIANDSLYVGGEFTQYGQNAAFALAKLDLNSGELDTIFGAVPGVDGSVHALAVDENSLYVGGFFNSYRLHASLQNIMKIDLTIGAPDPSFNRFGVGDTGLIGQVLALAISGDHLYVGGKDLYSFNYPEGGNIQGNVGKINRIDGQVDGTFSGPSDFENTGQVTSLAISGDSLYAGGDFTSYRGMDQVKYLAKLDLNTGSPDENFSSGTGFDSPVSSLSISDASIFVGGHFNQYRGTAIQRIAKLDRTSGVLDTGFTKSEGFGGYDSGGVTALVVSGSKLYAGGQFASYRGSGPLQNAPYCAVLDLTSGDLSDF